LCDDDDEDDDDDDDDDEDEDDEKNLKIVTCCWTRVLPLSLQARAASSR
jgi:hypothetical protein